MSVAADQQRAVHRRLVRFGACLVVLFGMVGWVGYQAARKAWARSYLQEAYDALDRQEFVRAQADLQVCLGYWPNDPELHFLAARTLRRAALLSLGEPDWDSRALRHLSTCEQLNYPPEDIALEKNLLLAMRADFEPAEAELVTLLIHHHPDSALILETLVPLYLARCHVPRAMIAVAQLLEERPDDPYAYYWRGMARDLLQSSRQAIADYRQALELKPDLDEARQLLALDLLSIEHHGDALGHLEMLRQRRPGDVAVELGIARSLHGLGRMEEAEQLLERLLAAHPHEGLALAEYGKLVLSRGKLEEAESYLRAAHTLLPHDAQLNYSLYLCLRRQGKNDEAAEHRARFAVIEADSKRYRRIIEQIGQKPQDAELRYQAGLLLLEHDQKTQGVGWLASALQVEPLHVGAHQVLADYYAGVGQQDRAAYHRRRATQGMLRLIQDLAIQWF